MPGFKTAKQELNIQAAKKNRQMPSKKTLGGKRPVHAQYVNPFKKEEENNQAGYGNANETGPEEPEDERLKGIDPKMIELIRNEIMDAGTKITWDDIAGLEYAKKIIQEIVVFPMLRPDIFTGSKPLEPKTLNPSIIYHFPSRSSSSPQRDPPLWSARNGQNLDRQVHRITEQVHFLLHLREFPDLEMDRRR